MIEDSITIRTIGYTVVIGKLEQGYIGRVGCHSRYYGTLDGLLSDLALYLKDPDKIIRQFLPDRIGKGIPSEELPEVPPGGLR